MFGFCLLVVIFCLFAFWGLVYLFVTLRLLGFIDYFINYLLVVLLGTDCWSLRCDFVAIDCVFLLDCFGCVLGVCLGYWFAFDFILLFYLVFGCGSVDAVVMLGVLLIK